MSPESPVAIIGMAIRTPGASSSDELWQLIQRSSSTSRKIPEGRFSAQNYHLEGPAKGRVLRVDTAHFLDDADQFDNELFRISPREARMMDPQQRILLHVAHEALEDAAYVPHSSFSSDPDHVGVFIGAATNDYVHNVREDIDIHYATGTLPAFLSGRISHSLSLGGPSIVFDTACSSSAVAIHAAVRSLRNGDSRMALAGGVNIITSPDLFMGLDAAHFLSRSGLSAPFDADADGYSRSEGCGLLVLKRLEDAEHDRDRILGVIGAIEVNQSYENSSITRTHGPTQAALIRRVLSKAEVLTDDIDIVEAHAAGTKQGDASELSALQTIFAKTPRRRPLYISSVKATIGHLEAASGVASVAKALLMMRYQTVPRQPGIRQPNSVVEKASSLNLIVPADDAVSWTRKDGTKPRRALVNNYGAAGSNVSLVLEEYVDLSEQDCQQNRPSTPTLVFGLSAPNANALGVLRDRYLEWVGKHEGGVSLLDFCYTSTARRQRKGARLAFSTNSTNQQEFVEALTASSIVVTSCRKPEVVFVYPGHGSQYPGMGKVLYDSCEVFKQKIDECDSLAVALGIPTILPYLVDGADAPPEEASLVEHVALLSFEVGLSSVWFDWRVSPTAVVGHSLGEYASLITAGVLSLKHALLLVGERARLVQRLCVSNETGMISVTLPNDTLRSILSNPSFPDAVIACRNSHNRHTVAGPVDQLTALRNHIRKVYGEISKPLPAQYGYHSAAMYPILEGLQQLLTGIDFERPSCIIASSVTGSVLSPDCRHPPLIGPNHLLRHCHDQVRFCEAIECLTAKFDQPESQICWIEISPHRTLLPLVRTMSQPANPAVFVDSMCRHMDPWASLTAGLSRLYMTDVEVDWRKVFASFGRPKCISLPPYPFQTRSFWVPYRDPSLPDIPTSLSVEPSGPFEEASATHPSTSPSNQHSHSTPCSDISIPLSSSRIETYSRAHVVASIPICPASVFVEAVLSGLTTEQGAGPNHILIRQLEFLRPHTSNEATSSPVRLDLQRCDDGAFNFAFARTQSDSAIQAVYSRGRCQIQPDGMSLSEGQDLASILARLDLLKPEMGGQLDTFTTKTVYEVIFPRAVEYEPWLRALDNVVVSEDQSEAHATMRLPPTNQHPQVDNHPMTVHPVYLDAMVHFAGFMANLRAGRDELFVCAGIGEFGILPSAFPTDCAVCPAYRLYTTISSFTPDALLAETIVITDETPLIVAVVKNIQFKRVDRNLFVERHRSPQTPLPSSTPSSANASSPGTAPRRRSATTAVDSPATPVSGPTSLQRILETSLLLPPGSIRAESSLLSLGLDSITSIEVLSLLQKEYAVKLPHGFFQEHATVGEAIRALEGGRACGADMGEGGLRRLQETAKGRGRPATCFVHDGTGTTACYNRLLDLGYDVWAIEASTLESDGRETVEGMGKRYAEALETQRFEHGVIVAGYSFGGVVAYEVAKALLDLGQTPVKGLLLLDSPPPTGEALLSTRLIDYIVERMGSANRPTLHAQLTRHTNMLSRYQGTGFSKTSFPCVYIRCSEAFGGGEEDKLDLNAWFTSRGDPETTIAQWRDVLKDSLTHVVEVGCHHFNMLDHENMGATSKTIIEACGLLEKSASCWGGN